ncbi:hypothetical protein D3C71_1294370 [compost metagenome]
MGSLGRRAQAVRGFHSVGVIAALEKVRQVAPRPGPDIEHPGTRQKCQWKILRHRTAHRLVSAGYVLGMVLVEAGRRCVHGEVNLIYHLDTQTRAQNVPISTRCAPLRSRARTGKIPETLERGLSIHALFGDSNTLNRQRRLQFVKAFCTSFSPCDPGAGFMSWTSDRCQPLPSTRMKLRLRR